MLTAGLRHMPCLLVSVLQVTLRALLIGAALGVFFAIVQVIVLVQAMRILPVLPFLLPAVSPYFSSVHTVLWLCSKS